MSASEQRESSLGVLRDLRGEFTTKVTKSTKPEAVLRGLRVSLNHNKGSKR